ncbi:MAG TPA: efflux RND transporter periplasmic adaptor subunit [Acetobacteraceae bacterium]|jgi:multidrug efflux system membrane fusion protein|nr:efflux RND transporter periplasmic adaptor subunit [Acetobacteraceae bacterium]
MDRRQRRMIVRLAAGVLGASVAVGIGFLGTSIAQTPSTTSSSSPAPQPDGAAIPVTIAPVTRQDVPVFDEGIGTVQAFQSVLIQARVTGWLDRIAFAEGQDVKPGDLLAEIDPRPYAATLAQVQAKSASDQATLANDEVNLKRDATLAQRSFQTQQQVDNDAAAVRVMQATLQGDAANIQTAALNLSFCRIAAPIAGVVGLRLVDVGNLISAGAGQGIVSITQIQPISVVFTLPQSELPQVQAAQAAGKPLVVAYSQDDRTALGNGELVATNNSISTGTGTITLKATFPNTDRHLWPGQFVNAHLQLTVDHNAVTVPVPAIQHGPDGLYVFVVGPNSTVASRPVSIGYQNQALAVVTKGLDGGEQVVVAGQSRLQDGTRVTSRSSKAAT